MSPTLRRSPWLGLLLMLFTFACGEPDRPVPPPVDSKPLLTLQGQLSLTPDHPVAGPVRLALAWYPGLLSEDEASARLSQPRTIVTDGSASPITAPGAYRFEVHNLPPTEALMPLPEGFQGNGAIGLLLAYSDRNANAKLDTIPPQGPPVDSVLGSSMTWTVSPAFLVVYVDSEQPAATGLRKGLNLVKLSQAQEGFTVVPSSTPIALALSGGPSLDLFVCEAAWAGFTGEAPCGLDFGNEPPGGELSLAGSLSVRSELLEVDLTVALVGEAVNDAVITLGGERVSFDAASGHYRSSSINPVVLTRPEGVELHVSARGQEVRRTLKAPGSFELDGSSQATSGAAYTARWTASQGAQSYNVSLEAEEQGNLGFAIGLSGTEHAFGAIEYSGAATLRVEAVSWLDDGRSGALELKQVRTQSLRFTPAEQLPPEGTLDVMGTVKVTRYGSETDLLVTLGGLPIGDAEVRLNNMRLTFNPDTFTYSMIEAIFGSMYDRGPVELVVRFHEQELRRTLVVPSAFTVLTPTLPAGPRSGQALHVSWEASAGAMEYNVMVVAAPGIIASDTTSNLETTLAPMEYTGLATLFVQATAFISSETQGYIELKRENTVPLRFAP
ncbi:MAG TPA: hypothetical protein VK539_02930 [Myxococcaceae bacterium]|nr:hypothetical protein [Myxococcaceae bacterium]